MACDQGDPGKPSDWEGIVVQDGIEVARAYGERNDVLRHIAHYAMMYEQDGPLDAIYIRPLDTPPH